MNKAEYYSASWCSPCRIYKPILENLQSEGYQIEFIDIDTDAEKASEKNVRSVPTMIFYNSDGEQMNRLVGVRSKDELKYYFGTKKE